MGYGKTGKMFSTCLSAVLVCSVMLACNRDRPRSRNMAAESGTREMSIVVNGLERTYLVHVPAAYKPQTPSPLVLMLHGGGGTAKATAWETEWVVKAEKERFLVVFPNALAHDPTKVSSFAGNPQLWNDGSDRFYPGQNAADDVGFIAAMLDDLSGRFAVDKGRIFVTGFSNGASMSFRVGAELSDRIAAIAPVAGALWFDPPPFKHPVSMCYITGTADPLNLIEGGGPKLATGASDSVRAKPKPPVGAPSSSGPRLSGVRQRRPTCPIPMACAQKPTLPVGVPLRSSILRWRDWGTPGLAGGASCRSAWWGRHRTSCGRTT